MIIEGVGRTKRLILSRNFKGKLKEIVFVSSSPMVISPSVVDVHRVLRTFKQFIVMSSYKQIKTGNFSHLIYYLISFIIYYLISLIIFFSINLFMNSSIKCTYVYKGPTIFTRQKDKAASVCN